MSTTASPNGQLEVGERCRALERECEELRERLARLENPPVPPRRRVRAIVADGLFVLLAGIVVAAVVGGIAIAAGVWKLDESEPPAASPQSAPATVAAEAEAGEGPIAGGAVTQTAPAESATTDAATANASDGVAVAAPPVRLVAGAVGGPCWLQVRRGGSEGEVVWEGILADGDSVNFEGTRFWIRVGDPTNLRLEVNGRRVMDLPTLAADLLVTETGARVVATG